MLRVAGLAAALACAAHFGSAAGSPGSSREEVSKCRVAGLPVEPGDMVRRVPPEQNAAPLYLLWMQWKRQRRFASADQPDPAKLANPRERTAELVRIGRVLQMHKAELDLIHRAVARRHCYFEKDWSLGPAVLFPELAEMRGMARWLIGSSELLLSRGQPVAAAREAALGFRIAGHCLETPAMLHALTAAAIDRMALKQLESIVLRADRGDVRSTVRHALAAARMPSVSDMLRGEPLMAFQAGKLLDMPDAKVRQLLGITGKPEAGQSVALGAIRGLMGDPDITPQDVERVRQLATKPGFSIKSLRREKIPFVLPVDAYEPARTDAAAHRRWVDANTALALSVTRRVAVAARRSTDAALDACYEAGDEVAQRTRQTVFAHPASGGLRPADTVLASILLTNLCGTLLKRPPDYTTARAALLLAATRVLDYRAANGRFPNRLQDALPKPPMDPFVGRPVKYRPMDRGFTLWCVGRTGTYDGVRDAKNEAVLRYAPAMP